MSSAPSKLNRKGAAQQGQSSAAKNTPAARLKQEETASDAFECSANIENASIVCAVGGLILSIVSATLLESPSFLVLLVDLRIHLLTAVILYGFSKNLALSLASLGKNTQNTLHAARLAGVQAWCSSQGAKRKKRRLQKNGAGAPLFVLIICG